jgi:hypothetical protein
VQAKPVNHTKFSKVFFTEGGANFAAFLHELIKHWPIALWAITSLGNSSSLKSFSV